MVKVLALYPEAFWRAEGLSGLGIGDLPLLGLTVDSSPPGGRPGLLASFIAADAAAHWQRQDAKTRQARVLAEARGFRVVEVDYDELRGMRPDELRLF
jgi:monoamine oxidase